MAYFWRFCGMSALWSPRTRLRLARAASVAEQRRRLRLGEEHRMKLLLRAAACLVAGRFAGVASSPRIAPSNDLLRCFTRVQQLCQIV